MSSPLMALYHFNVGFPLVGAGARLHVPYEKVVPRDDRAVPGLNRWPEYDAATPQYAEQVFFHHVKAGQDGTSEALLTRNNVGLAIRWDTRTLPYLTQWKNTRQGIYVSGIEPANCLPEGRSRARDSGRLVMIEPGDSKEFSCSLTMLGSAVAIQNCQQRINTLMQTGRAVQGCDLSGYPS